MADLKLIDVGKTYGGSIEVLKDINLDIKQGELIVFVGPSGCGKSTLLRMIAGLEKITGGELQIDGQVVNDVPPAQRDMTVRDNMSFALKLAKKTPAEIEAAVSNAAKILQLDEYLDRLPKALSGGQRQRVAIGRSIVRDPKFYLFDEPLSNLDAALRVATRIEIAQLKESMPESTMIYVTHDQVEAMTLATRIVVLANKGVAQVGTPLELYERPENEFVAQFIGSPAMNLLSGKITETGAITTVALDGGGSAKTAVSTQAADKGLQVNIGVRPEDLIETTGKDFVFEGTVKFTEALGEVTLLYFDKVGDNDSVIGKLPGIHMDLRGTSVRMKANPSKVQVFHDGQSLHYR